MDAEELERILAGVLAAYDAAAGRRKFYDPETYVPGSVMHRYMTDRQEREANDGTKDMQSSGMQQATA